MKKLLLLVVGCASSSEPAPKPLAPPPPALPDGKLVSSAGLVGNNYEVRAQGHRIDLATHPLAAFLGGLPVSGLADVDVSIDVGNGNADLAWGHANLACTGCKLGDDTAKIQLGKRASAFSGEGIWFGHVAIDRAAVKVAIGSGVAKIAGWEWQSPDLDIQLSGTVQLARDAQQSAVHACIRFKPSDKLQQEQPKTYAVIALTGGTLNPDGYFSIALEGTVGDLKRIGRSCP